MEKFHITKEDIEWVLWHRYTQDDYTKGIGPHKTDYEIFLNHTDYVEAFWQTALVLEASARQKEGISKPIDLPALLEHLKKSDKG